MRLPEDETLGRLLSLVVGLLVLLIAYLVLLLPFTSRPGAVGAAIGVLGTLLSAIVLSRAARK